jgi:hypothetical protein
MRVPQPHELGLIQPTGKPDEWWVTLNGKAVIGFTGAEARTRAERQLDDLLRIAASSREPMKEA